MQNLWCKISWNPECCLLIIPMLMVTHTKGIWKKPFENINLSVFVTGEPGGWPIWKTHTMRSRNRISIVIHNTIECSHVFSCSSQGLMERTSAVSHPQRGAAGEEWLSLYSVMVSIWIEAYEDKALSQTTITFFTAATSFLTVSYIINNFHVFFGKLLTVSVVVCNGHKI